MTESAPVGQKCAGFSHACPAASPMEGEPTVAVASVENQSVSVAPIGFST